MSFINVKKSPKKAKEPKPRTAQETIPYYSIYDDGIIESKPQFFTKAYKLDDINFSAASDVEQEKIFDNYVRFLNSFSSNTRIQLVIHNKTIDNETAIQKVKIRMKSDSYNEYREDYNKLLEIQSKSGRNNIITDKYLVIGVEAVDVEEARIQLGRNDSEIKKQLTRLAKTSKPIVKTQTIEDRLTTIQEIITNKEIKGDERIDIATLTKRGDSTKDFIAPSGFYFNSINDFRMGNLYARTIFVKNYPSLLNTDVVSSIASLPINVVASYNIIPLSQDKAIKKLNDKATGIRGDVIDAEKQAFKAGYSGDLISPKLKYAHEQANELIEEVQSGDQKLFLFSCTFLITADTLDELNMNEQTLLTELNTFIIKADRLSFRQEDGFKTVLPLCRDDGITPFTMPSDNVALFIPFNSVELMDEGGIYYGLNANTKNMLIYDRTKGNNPNGIIVGTPGSGKSMAAKQEIASVFLNTDDDIIIIDPEGEYSELIKAFNGAEIKLAQGSTLFLNPFDMDLQYGDEDNQTNLDPVKVKSDYILSLVDTMIGKTRSLTLPEQSLISSAVVKMYRPYLEQMRLLQDKSITCQPEFSPTLIDFIDAIRSENNPYAPDLAAQLELYTTTHDIFAHKTNIEVNNRFTVYNIKSLGSGLKETGYMVCLDHIWNTIIANFAKGKRTRIYIDEAHHALKTPTAAEYLSTIWRRARKWDGVPTAITQSIVDFNSEAGFSVLDNSSFMMILSQKPTGIEILRDHYNLSESQLAFIDESPFGQGLIRKDGVTIPFVNEFPQNLLLYKLFTTKPDDKKKHNTQKTDRKSLF